MDTGLTPGAATAGERFKRTAEVFGIFLALGLTSFGGPVAHLGYFRAAFVARRRWLDDADYADLVALCQFLPGPASSQVGIAIGRLRAGLPGAFAAWVGFTLPSVLLLYLFSLGIGIWQGPIAAGILHGLKIAALAVVAQAVWQMARTLAPDARRRAIALTVAVVVLVLPFPAIPVLVLALAGLGGYLTRRAGPTSPPTTMPAAGWGSAAALAGFAILLVLLPLGVALTGDPTLGVLDRFYRAGALVFGGGHIVLPLLEHELVGPGLIDRDLFIAGYGAAQAVPGPLFSFAFYAGAMLHAPPNGLFGGLLALAAIYLPSFLLVLGALPYWERWKHLPRLRAALDAANAAVVGLLLAALYDPVFTGSVAGPADFAFALIALGLLAWRRLPPWAVVLLCGAAGAALAFA